MATLTLPEFEPAQTEALHQRATSSGLSMPTEAQLILNSALQMSTDLPVFAARIRNRFAGLGDIGLRIPKQDVHGNPDLPGPLASSA